MSENKSLNIFINKNGWFCIAYVVYGALKNVHFCMKGGILDPLLVWFRTILRVTIWLMGFLERWAEYLDEIHIPNARNGPVNFKLLRNFEKWGLFLTSCFRCLFLFSVFRPILAMKWRNFYDFFLYKYRPFRITLSA